MSWTDLITNAEVLKNVRTFTIDAKQQRYRPYTDDGRLPKSLLFGETKQKIYTTKKILYKEQKVILFKELLSFLESITTNGKQCRQVAIVP